MSGLALFLIISGAVLLAFVLFSGWIFIKALKLIVRSINWVLGIGHRPQVVSSSLNRCPRPNCHADNATTAQFCRRCGTSLAMRHVQARRLPLQRAAMW